MKTISTENVQPKPYVSYEEAAALTPFSVQALKDMKRKGILVEGKHVFHVRRRVVIKWLELVRLIENRDGTNDGPQRGK